MRAEKSRALCDEAGGYVAGDEPVVSYGTIHAACHNSFSDSSLVHKIT